MTAPEFFAVPAEERLVDELSALSPTNPFVTWSYFQAKNRVGRDPWVLGLRKTSGQLLSGCGAYLSLGRLSRTLAVPSLPQVGADSSFWDGLCGFCREHRVTTLAIETFSSPAKVEIPQLGSDSTKRNRCEFVLDLKGDLASMLRSNHRRNVKKAERSNLTIRRTRTAEAAIIHRKLMNQSMDRRRLRGENVGRVGASLEHIAYLDSGAGELFQTVRDDRVLSSVLLLHAPNGGYYQSAGTSPEGMAMCASHFLINRIAIALREEGGSTLNLGGADVDSGLGRFKEGFGASRVPLPAATFFLGAMWRRKIFQVIELFRAGQTILSRPLTH